MFLAWVRPCLFASLFVCICFWFVLIQLYICLFCLLVAFYILFLSASSLCFICLMAAWHWFFICFLCAWCSIVHILLVIACACCWCFLCLILTAYPASLPCSWRLPVACFFSNVFSLAAVSFPHCPVCLLLVFLFVKSALFIFLLPGCCVCWHVCLCACCWFSCLFMSACCWCFHICHVCLLLIGSFDGSLDAIPLFHLSPASVFAVLSYMSFVHVAGCSCTSCLAACECFIIFLSACYWFVNMSPV